MSSALQPHWLSGNTGTEQSYSLIHNYHRGSGACKSNREHLGLFPEQVWAPSDPYFAVVVASVFFISINALTQLSCLIVLRDGAVNYLPWAGCKVPNCFNWAALIAIPLPLAARPFCLSGALRGLAGRGLQNALSGKVLPKWWQFWSTRPRATANYWEVRGEPLPTSEKTLLSWQKVLYQLGAGQQLKHSPASFQGQTLGFVRSLWRLKSTFFTPSQRSASPGRKVARSHLPAEQGQLPGARLPRRWCSHSAHGAGAGSSSWGYRPGSITWKIPGALWSRLSLSSSSSSPPFLEGESSRVCWCNICCAKGSSAEGSWGADPLLGSWGSLLKDAEGELLDPALCSALLPPGLSMWSCKRRGEGRGKGLGIISPASLCRSSRQQAATG